MKQIILIAISALFSLGLQADPKYERGRDTGGANDMIYIPGGYYTPFLQTSGRIQKVNIAPFYLDVHAVTNQEFLEFVKRNPRWAKSKIPSLLADGNYLQQWEGDFTIGNNKILTAR